MPVPSLSSKQTTSTANSRQPSRGTQSSSNRKLHKNENVKKATSAEQHANITIRLSDLGIIKRSPSEVELQIQSGRVLFVLDRTVEKLQVALCLSHLLKNNALLMRKYLQDAEVEFIQHVCLKYTFPNRFAQLKSVPFQTISAIVEKISINESSAKRKMGDKLSVGLKDNDQLIDPHMAQVMEILWKAHGLKEKVHADFDKLVDAPSFTLISSIKRLREIAAEKLAVTAREQRSREQQLSRAWQANSQAEENIEKVRQQLLKQRQDLGNQVQVKNALVLDYESRVDTLTMKFREDVIKKIKESEKGMAEDSHASTIRQADLAVEAKAATQQYEGLLSQHLSYEKGLRAKRFKVETQLSSWLAKFDADIGERQAEFEEITRGYEEEMSEMLALKEKCDEQEEEYVVLMAEKEEEERRIWEERAYEYLRTRSARKIQRYWRAYRQRKIDKKKAKLAKAKAKKQKSAEAAEGGGEKSAEKEKKPKGGKDKKAKGKGKPAEPAEFRGADPMAALEKKFGGDLLGDLEGGDFPAGQVVVEL